MVCPAIHHNRVLSKRYHIRFFGKFWFTCLLLVFASFQFLVFRRSLDSFSFPSQNQSTRHVTVWKAPDQCSGSFSSSGAHHSRTGVPYVLLREASVDRRPVIKRLFGKDDRQRTVRILLFFSVHLSANLTAHGSSVSLDETECQIDHVSQVYSGNRAKVSVYRPGMTIYKGKEMTAWQIGIAIPFLENINRRELHIDLLVTRYDGEQIRVQMNLPLRCVMGWDLNGVDNVEAECFKNPNTVDGAAVFLGSPLFGESRRKGRRLVAHMAARAFLGPVTFDALFITAANEYSLSEYDAICGKDSKCREDLDKRNNAFFSDLVRTIESELDFLRVPPEMYSRIHIIPTCRFGTHITGDEERNPCNLSLSGGQYMNMFYTYSMVAPYFRWAASFDLDEYVGAMPGFRKEGSITAGHAVDVLNSFDSFTPPKRAGYMHFSSFNFQVVGRTASRTLTRAVLNHRLPKLVRKNDSTDSNGCLEFPAIIKYGKAAVRCDVGVGFDIHYPFAFSSKSDSSLKYVNKKRKAGGLVIWHGRYGFTHGRCKLESK